ncbi:hypothetical protein AX17_001063 [Amanita inopinata Kibby_2008]|nr:hypothetical protein AX17_001063 [Amanita inopinata Kibby_2008]
MQVTISVLPVSLSLVHIPRSRLAHISHPIIRQILQPDPVFLSITSNEIELSIFTEFHALQEFESIARRDRHKQRAQSGSGSSRQSPTREFEPIEVSYEKWRVLQIDSHSDRPDISGARVNELSAPLAAAGISILYQSSYMSDFIFVKESRLQEALDLFSAVGFDLYSTESSGQAVELRAVDDGDHTQDVGPVGAPNSGTILTRSRSSTDTSVTSANTPASGIGNRDDITPQQSHDYGRVCPHSNSHHPGLDDVQILSPDLACVGLSDELGVDHWGLKIIKLVAFPDLISPLRTCPSKASLATLVTKSHLSALENPIFSDLSIPYGPVDLCVSPSPSFSSDEDDGYFSHSPQNQFQSSLPRLSSRSQSDFTRVSPPGKPSKHHKSHPAPSRTPCTIGSDDSNSDKASGTLRKQNESIVPFFSFTRTAEGSSLTTDVYLLATLFPPHERHMVICGSKLDVVDEHLYSPEFSDEEGEAAFSDVHGNVLKCLQIDLRQFGLDTHGLVNRFSRILDDNEINHMYSSTFKTANLLVDKRHVSLAQQLLCSL